MAESPPAADVKPEGRAKHVGKALLEASLITALTFGLIAGTTFAGKSGGASPTIAVSTVMNRAPTSNGSLGSLHVTGSNFTPSSGGQQVWLWVAYPNDYCAPDKSTCHGFYAYPWVNADGTFDVTYDNALLQSGTGAVSAHQWNVKTGKWQTVATDTYTVN